MTGVRVERNLTTPLVKSLLRRAGSRSLEVDLLQPCFLSKGREARERNPGMQRMLTLLPPVLVPRFQLSSHIYHRSGQEVLSCRCGTLYSGLCCKAPIGEPHGLPCPPEDSSLSSRFSQLLTEFLHQATVALSFLTR